ncbi:MAG TPA: hypothetical protein VGR24_08095 [bacterium]|jgi:hypothetical protein|nr:hypothetical protein [bacterium]
MALLFTFPCGSCGRKYTVYYPKALMYELSGTAPRQLGEQEDTVERASGAIESAREATERTGNIWVDAGVELERVCVCGKQLDFNLMHHPRVPQSKTVLQKRQTGLIPFPTEVKKR